VDFAETTAFRHAKKSRLVALELDACGLELLPADQ
jgi:hypothetical protein